MNARERVVDIAQALKYGDGSYGELRDALDAYREAILRDTEVVEGRWKAKPLHPTAALLEGEKWYAMASNVEQVECPDERTAKAYASALNRADRYLGAK